MFVLASNHFWKCFSINASIWLHMENNFSGNYFQLIECFEGFDPKMVWSENFHFKPFSDSHAEREREPSTSTSPTSTSPIYEPTNLQTDHAFNFVDHSFDFVDFADLRPRAFDPRTFNFAGDLEPSHHEPIFDPSPSTQSHEPTNRSLSVCDFDWPTNPWAFDLWFFCCCGGVGGGVLVVFLLCGGGFYVGGGGK